MQLLFRLFLLLSLFFPSLIWSQGLQGLINDTSGVPVAFARIRLIDQEHGVLTDEQGQFVLDLETGTHTLMIEHLGFEAQTLTLEVPYPGFLRIRLVPKDVQLEAVDIMAGKKDPAYAIMKELIAHKGEHMDQIESYSAETYMKIRLETDTLPGFSGKKKRKPKKPKEKKDKAESESDSTKQDTIIHWPQTQVLIESQSTTYFRAPGTYKSIVHAYLDRNQARSQSSGLSVSISFEGEDADYASSASNPYLFYTDVSEVDINFYRNLMTSPRLGDRPFVSPLNNTLWRVVYVFKLIERRYIQGRVQYKIQVTPRSAQGPYVSGYIWVVDGDWALQAVDLKLMPSALAYFDEMRIQQRFARRPDGRWVEAESHFNYQVREGKKMQRGQTDVWHSGYKLDIPFKRNFFKNELQRTDAEAFEVDSATWAQIRPVALQDEEEQFIHQQDSIIAYRRSDEYLSEQDSIYNRLTILDILFNGMSFRDRKRGMHYTISPIVEQIQPLGVGGYRHQLGGGITRIFPRKKRFGVGGEIDYGFANQDLRGRIRFNYTYNPRRFARAYIRAGDEYELINDFETIRNFLSRGNLFNQRFIGAGNRIELVNGLILDTKFNFADKQAADTLQWNRVWELASPGDTVTRGFDPFRELRFEVSLRWTPGQKYRMLPYQKIVVGSKWPTFTLQYKKAIPNIWGTSLDFDFVSIRAEQSITLRTLGTARWEFLAGKFLQTRNLQLTDFRFFRGSDRWFFANPLKAFQLLGNTKFTNQDFVEGHYLHDFNGGLIDRIPLLNRLPLQMTVGGGAMYIGQENFWHGEVFAGLQVPFRIRMQRFKVGAFYVASYDNEGSQLDNQIKFGITFFNPVQNRWTY